MNQKVFTYHICEMYRLNFNVIVDNVHDRNKNHFYFNIKIDY